MTDTELIATLARLLRDAYASRALGNHILDTRAWATETRAILAEANQRAAQSPDGGKTPTTEKPGQGYPLGAQATYNPT